MTLRPPSLGLLTALLLAPACGDDGGGGTDSGGGSGSAGSTSSDPTTGSAPTTGATSSASGGTGGGDTNPFDDPVECHSGKLWTMGEIETPLMHPGRACLDCHSMSDEPEIQGYLQLAGTVYDFGHDPDECYGVDGSVDPVTVEITDAMNTKFTLPVGPSGNFLMTIEDPLVTFPIAALVRRGDAVRAMGSKQSIGDCNSCHTQGGMNGAPGRIVAP